jgi:hypothetical protein
MCLALTDEVGGRPRPSRYTVLSPSRYSTTAASGFPVRMLRGHRGGVRGLNGMLARLGVVRTSLQKSSRCVGEIVMSAYGRYVTRKA